MNPFSNCSFIILSGGKSSRFGSAKYKLLYKNKTFLETLVQLSIDLSFGETIISGVTKDTASEYLPSLVYSEPPKIYYYTDELENRGPLGGLYTCFKHATYTTAFVITVDCPSIPSQLIKDVVTSHLQNDSEVTLLQYDTKIDPLIGVYKTRFSKQIYPVIQESSAPVFRALDCITYNTYKHDYKLLNINTVSDYDNLLKT
ncbi:MAG: molybdenum cofactor guanylyltransferase [Eubacteriales bacterium]